MNKIKRKNKQDKGIVDKTSPVSTVLDAVHVPKKKVSNHNKGHDRRTKMKIKGKIPSWIIGIDEVGRGPLAGPVAVTAYAIPFHKSKSNTYASHRKFLLSFSGNKYPNKIDSKAMSEKEREKWSAVLRGVQSFYSIKNLSTVPEFHCVYKTASASSIDTKGISSCIQSLVDACLNECLKKILKVSNLKCTQSKPHILVLLDGGLKSGVESREITIEQKTIVKGDVREMVISLASVYAKCTRDAYMRKISKNTKYSVYGFDVHKGYGTSSHRLAIRTNGLSDQHRKSFCKRVV